MIRYLKRAGLAARDPFGFPCGSRPGFVRPSRPSREGGHHHGNISIVDQAVTDARAAVLDPASAENPKEAVARWNDTAAKITTVADANGAALDHLDRQVLPLAQDATSGSGNDTVLAINQIKQSHLQAAKSGIGPAWQGIGDAVARPKGSTRETDSRRREQRPHHRPPAARNLFSH